VVVERARGSRDRVWDTNCGTAAFIKCIIIITIVGEPKENRAGGIIEN